MTEQLSWAPSALGAAARQPDLGGLCGPSTLWFGSNGSPAFGPAVPLLALPGLLCCEGQAVPAARALSGGAALRRGWRCFVPQGADPSGNTAWMWWHVLCLPRPLAWLPFLSAAALPSCPWRRLGRCRDSGLNTRRAHST